MKRLIFMRVTVLWKLFSYRITQLLPRSRGRMWRSWPLCLDFFALREYLPCFYGFKYCSGCLNGVTCFLAYTNFVYILRDQNNIYIWYVIFGTINPYLRSISDRLPCYDVEITRVSVVILKLDGENNVWWFHSYVDYFMNTLFVFMKK